MGEIMEVSEAASNVTYKIDDRTGPWIDVKRWMDEQVRGREELRKLSVLKPNLYI